MKKEKEKVFKNIVKMSMKQLILFKISQSYCSYGEL